MSRGRSDVGTTGARTPTVGAWLLCLPCRPEAEVFRTWVLEVALAAGGRP